MLDIHESGLLQIWKAKRWPKQGICHGSLLSERKPISLIDVQSAFYLIAVGLTLSFIVVAAEFVFKLIQDKRNREKKIIVPNLIRRVSAVNKW